MSRESDRRDGRPEAGGADKTSDAGPDHVAAGRAQVAAWRQEFTELTGISARDDSAVKAWQAQHGVEPTGLVRRQTIAAARQLANGGAAGRAQKQEGGPGMDFQTQVYRPETDDDAHVSIPGCDPVAASSEQQPAMDPSVEALFNPVQSTDEEMGTSDNEVRQQADSCRLALEKHFDAFKLASTIATKIALAGVAGMGKQKIQPSETDKAAKLAMIAVKLAWSACGGAKEIEEVIGIAKEELLGPMESYADKAYEFAKGQLEKHATEFSLNDVIEELTTAVTQNTNEFVEKGKAHVGSMKPELLAQTWRLISGTRDNMTVHGDKLDAEQKETVTTEMIEMMTGIDVSGKFSEELANTVQQQARVDFAAMQDNPTDRNAALAQVLNGDVGEQTKRIAHETGEDEWINKDKELRGQVTE
jgi:hypothetical protein